MTSTSTIRTITPEQHTTELMDAIERELITHGAASLAEVIANVADAYADDDDYHEHAAAWRAVRRAFGGLAATVPTRALPRPVDAGSAVVVERGREGER